MKVHDLEHIYTKLEMETRNTHDRLAFFVHNGRKIVRTRRSHGNSKFIPEDWIRLQLKVNEDQFAGLQSCSVSRNDYIQILTEKGLIEPPAQPKPKPAYWRIVDTKSSETHHPTFPTKDRAASYRRDTLSDSNGERYTIVAIGEDGKPIES